MVRKGEISDWEGCIKRLIVHWQCSVSRSGLWFHECAYLVMIHQAIH